MVEHTKDQPFYIHKKGKNVLKPNDIKQFFARNKSLACYAEQCQLELRLLELPMLDSLCYWIISQQISGHVANRIIQRFSLAFKPLTPEKLLQTDVAELRALGLSHQKSQYIKNTAEFFVAKPLFETHYKALSSAEVIRELTTIKGIGEWTVQMHLIFCAGRMDILATKDLVVRKGMQYLYSLADVPNEKHANALCKNWGELATVGTILCWAILGE